MMGFSIEVEIMRKGREWNQVSTNHYAKNEVFH